MKKITALVFLALLTTLSLRADVIFQDSFNYPNGLIETDGVWKVYSPTVPVKDCYVETNLLILNSTNSDSVAAAYTNDTGSSIIYASFTINVSSLPNQKGGYFEQLMDTNGSFNAAARIFISTTNTVVPGTYQLGIGNYTPYVYLANFYPLDLATGITYQVVFSFDTNAYDELQGATLAVNPAYQSDLEDSPAFGTDRTTTPALLAVKLGRIGFSQYTGQGVAGIGNVVVGTSFSDVQTNIPQLPVIGVQPQSTNIDSYNVIQLYVAASGLGQLTYQWLSNNVPMVDDGTTVTGSQANVLNLLAPTTTANYSVIVGNSAGTTNSQVAVVTVNTALAVPHMTVQPTNVTSAVSKSVTLYAAAAGTGPLTYNWYFQSTNQQGYVFAGSGQTLPLVNLSASANAGTYYVNVVGSVGQVNSTVITLTVLPPVTVPIGYLHSLMTTNSATTISSGNTVYNIQGVVTTFVPLTASAYQEFGIQDNTGGAIVYIGAAGTNTVPPPGTLVSINGQAQIFNGYLEFAGVASGPGAATNGYTVLSNSVAMPPTLPLNVNAFVTNPTNAYSIGIQNSLATLTNVYFYSSAKGAALSATASYYSNSYTKIYATEGPYGTPANNTNTLLIFVAAYGPLATNFWNQPIPHTAYEVSGVVTIYSTPEFDVTRFQDIVTNVPAPFTTSITSTGGISTLGWPALVGSTYSVLSATNLLGPWTPAFGLSYYPSIGTYTATNAAAAEFYKVTTP